VKGLVIPIKALLELKKKKVYVADENGFLEPCW